MKAYAITYNQDTKSVCVHAEETGAIVHISNLRDRGQLAYALSRLIHDTADDNDPYPMAAQKCYKLARELKEYAVWTGDVIAARETS